MAFRSLCVALALLLYITQFAIALHQLEHLGHDHGSGPGQSVTFYSAPFAMVPPPFEHLGRAHKHDNNERERGPAETEAFCDFCLSASGASASVHGLFDEASLTADARRGFTLLTAANYPPARRTPPVRAPPIC